MISEYQEIADHIRQAIDEVYYGVKEPKEALDDAATNLSIESQMSSSSHNILAIAK